MDNNQLPEQTWIYQQMMISAPFGMMLVDALQADFPIIYVNPAFEQITGYSAAEVMGKNSGFLQGMDRDQAAREAMRIAIEKAESCITVVRNYRKDGSLFWNEVSLTPLRDPQGVITYYFGTQKDVTVREEAKRAVELSEQRYRQMFDSNTAIKLVIDPTTGNIKDANIAAAEFYGYTREHLRSLHITDLNGASREKATEMLRETMHRERHFLEVRHRLASGEVRDIDAYVSPVDTPEGRFLYEIVIDVTGRRLAALEYQALFQQSNDAVFILDLDGNYRRVNQRAADLFGYTVDELEGLSYRDLIVPADKSKSLDVLARLQYGERIPPYERTFKRKDGSLIHTEVNVELVRDHTGKPLHIQSVVRDITERKVYADLLRENEAKFRAIVEGSVDGILMTNEAGSLIEWNAGMTTLSGLLPERVLGRKLWDVRFQLEPEAQKTAALYGFLKNSLQTVLQTGSSDFLQNAPDLVLQRPDGSQVIVQVSLFPIKTVNGYRIGGILHDITERHTLEETLRASEAKYRLLAENTSDVIYVLNANRQFLYASPAVERMLGYSSAELIAMTPDEVMALTHPEDRPHVLEQLQLTIIEKIINFGIERRLRHKDGHYIWTEDRATLDYSPAGDFTGAQIVSRDVSARKAAEQALSLSEERLRTIIDHIPVMISFYDATGKVQFANRFWTDRLGWTVEDIQAAGDPLVLFFPDAEIRQQAMEYMLSGIQGWRDFDIATKQHGTLSTSWWNVPLSDGRTIGIGQDITERHQMEQALRASEEKFRLIAENMSDGIIIFDVQGRATYASPGYDRQYGWSTGESLVRSPERYADVLHPDDREATLSRIRQAIYNHEETLTYSCRTQHSAGHYFWREDHARFKYGSDGSYLGTYIVTRDITERKRREEIEYKLRLEKDRLDILTRFFSEAVHEFSTPLSTIATGIYLLSRSDDAQRRALKAKQLEGEIDRINRLLQSLVLIMKVENVDSSEISLINLGEAVQSECRVLETRHQGQPALQLDVAADLPAVMGYSDYLDHAFRELLGNAYRFTPADGTVTVTVSSAEKELVVDIHDTGSGIADEDLPYIFDTFWRKDEAHTTPGFGLGLAIAKRIIEQHGGTISVTSELGQGTHFRVLLPIAPLA